MRLYAAFAATRRIYPLLPVSLCLPLFLLQCVNLPTSLLPRFFSTSFAAILYVSLHVRADYALSSRNYFAYMLSPFTLSLSIFLPFATIHPHPSADRPSPLSSAPRGTITRPSIKYTFVGGPAMWRPVIYFSSNCNFSNTYCPLDKCARLFLTR